MALKQTLTENRYSWGHTGLPWNRTPLKSLSKDELQIKEIEHCRTPIELQLSDQFVVYIAIGSNYDETYDCLMVDSTGKMVFNFVGGGAHNKQVYELKKKLRKEQIQSLRRFLNKNRLGHMKKSYVAASLADGTQGGFTLVKGTDVRRTFFSNYFPVEFQRLCEYCRDEIVKCEPQNAQLTQGKTLLHDTEALKAIQNRK